MSFFRRRQAGDRPVDTTSDNTTDASDSSNAKVHTSGIDASPIDAHGANEEQTTGRAVERYEVVTTKRLDNLRQSKGAKRRHAWVFVLGGLFGLALAALFADNSDIIDLATFKRMNLESVYEVLPAGFVKDARDLQVCFHHSIPYSMASGALCCEHAF